MEQTANVVEFTPEQAAHIRTQLQAFNDAQPPLAASAGANADTDLGFSLSCALCMTGLNIVAAVPLGIAIVAGVAFGPELACVAAIAGFFGVEAASVAAVLNAMVAAGGGTSVEAALEGLCEEFGAC